MVEMAPGQFMQIILEIDSRDPDDWCSVNLDTVFDDLDLDVFGAPEPVRVRPQHHRADIRLTGRVVAQEDAERPAWADAHVGRPAQIGAPTPQIEGFPTDG